MIVIFQNFTFYEQIKFQVPSFLHVLHLTVLWHFIWFLAVCQLQTTRFVVSDLQLVKVEGKMQFCTQLYAFEGMNIAMFRLLCSVLRPDFFY